ncbi:hypothetical protein N8925_01185 [Candidatus Pelagibacter sp.]|nr:hypothetical protein [Candidatus Pelagibacter sp.]
MHPFKKNPPNWTKDEILNEMEIFIPIYKTRPIKANYHGMMFPHMFATYFILRKLKPEFVIESGVYKGQSTWLIEKSLPDAKILSIDIDLKQRSYISNKARYSNVDFKYHDFSNIPDNTLAFFDDHQSHLDRIRETKFFNIKHIILEDNYPALCGDFLTMRHIYANKGFNHPLNFNNILKTAYLLFNLFIKKKFKDNYYISLDEINSRLRDRKPNSIDFKNIEKIMETYFEFPPIINIKSNWGYDTAKELYRTEKPLIDYDKLNLNEFSKELQIYNYITYIKLR